MEFARHLSPSPLEASPPLCRRVKVKCKGAVMGAEREPHMGTYYSHGPPLPEHLSLSSRTSHILTKLYDASVAKT